MQPFMFIHYSKPSLLHSHYLARALGRFIKNKKKQEKKNCFSAKLVAFQRGFWCASWREAHYYNIITTGWRSQLRGLGSMHNAIASISTTWL